MGKTKIILDDLKKAMLGQQADRVAVLRMLTAALKNARIAKNADLDEAEEIGVLKKEVKKRQEAIEMFKKGEREDLVKQEQAELKMIKPYLPQEMGEAEVKQIVKEMKAAGELGDNFGEAMKAVMAKLKGQAEGKLVAEAVKAEL